MARDHYPAKELDRPFPLLPGDVACREDPPSAAGFSAGVWREAAVDSGGELIDVELRLKGSLRFFGPRPRWARTSECRLTRGDEASADS